MAQLHARSEQAEFFYQASAFAGRAQGQARGILDPEYPQLTFSAWLRQLRLAVQRYLDHDFEVPLGLVLCLCVPPESWPSPGALILAGLGLSPSRGGMQLYARSRLVREPSLRVRQLLQRSFEPGAGALARYWIATAALELASGAPAEARSCLRRAEGDPTRVGDWARLLLYCLSLRTRLPARPPSLVHHCGARTTEYEHALAIGLRELFSARALRARERKLSAMNSAAALLALRNSGHRWCLLAARELERGLELPLDLNPLCREEHEG